MSQQFKLMCDTTVQLTETRKSRGEWEKIVLEVFAICGFR